MNEKRGTVLFIPHGGGPLPILGDPYHKKLVKFIENIKFYKTKNKEPYLIHDLYDHSEITFIKRK